MISVKKVIYKTITKLSSMASTLSSHTSTLSSHTSTLSSHGTTISGHTTSINSHTSRISALEGRWDLSSESKSVSNQSIPANTVKDISISVTKSGYTPIAIGAISKSGTGNGYCVPTAWYLAGNTAHVTLYNTASSAATVTIAIICVYAK